MRSLKKEVAAGMKLVSIRIYIHTSFEQSFVLSQCVFFGCRRIAKRTMFFGVNIYYGARTPHFNPVFFLECLTNIHRHPFSINNTNFTWFSDFNLRFSSLTASTLWDKSVTEKQKKTQLDSFPSFQILTTHEVRRTGNSFHCTLHLVCIFT